MINFLFWNINRKPIAPLVAQIAWERRVDVLVLAECEIDPMALLDEINRSGSRFSLHDYPGRFLVYTQFELDWLQSAYDESYLSVRHLVHPQYSDMILGIVHLPSKSHMSDGDQADLATRLRRSLERVESNFGHSRTVLFGDFNMNPFERGMAGSESFHAVMDRNTAREQSRIVHRERRDFFYNPMWSLMGDLSKGPPGTYYYRQSVPLVYFWHTLDQVLIRPSLMPYFNSEVLEIITKVGNDSLLSDNGRPDANRASDHLPLFFSLALPSEDEI